MIVKQCSGCGQVFRHSEVEPFLAQQYRELVLVCGHHKNHAGWMPLNEKED